MIKQSTHRKTDKSVENTVEKNMNNKWIIH